MSTPVIIHRRQKQTAARIGQKGKIFAWTLIRIPAKQFSPQAPYPVAIVELENGEKVIGQIVDSQQDDLQIGREVIAVLRRLGTEDKESVINYTIKFKPL